MLPALTMRASGLPGRSSTILPPAMKRAGSVPAADTTRPAVFTCAPWWKITPDWFTSTTWPLALIRPAICDGLAEFTVFSVIARAFGCWNVTD